MNGRCKNDPLDAADDVCGICSGEFCSDCLIKARVGRAKLVCKVCAVDHSGLRAGQKTKIASNRQVRKQKRTLKSSGKQGGNTAFTFFDDPDSEFAYDLENAREAPGRRVVTTSSPGADNLSKKGKKRRGKSNSTVPKSKATAKPSKAEPKTRRSTLTSRSKNNLVEAAMAGPSAIARKDPKSIPAPTSRDIPAPTSKDVATEPLAPAAQVKSVTADPPPPAASEATPPPETVKPKREPMRAPVTMAPVEPAGPSAADLLSVLKADEAAAGGPALAGKASDNLNLETSPFSDPFSMDAGTAEPISAETPMSAGADGAQHKRRSPGAGTVSGQGRQSRSTISDPFAAGSESPFLMDTPETAPFLADPATTASESELVPQEFEYKAQVLEPETSEPQSFETQSFETQSFDPQSFETESFETQAFETQAFETESFETQSFETQSAEPQAFKPESFETQAFETQSFETQSFETESFETQSFEPEPVLVSAAAESESYTDSTPGAASPDLDKADTDQKGDWIPPLLRGMAPAAERKKLPLPHRHDDG